MAYCQQTDLLNEITSDDLTAITDDAGAGQPSAGVITDAIADADAEIDAYLGTRYDVPLTYVPAIVKKWSVTIAIYNLYARRRGAPSDRKERYQNVIRALEQVSKGFLTIGKELTPEPETDSSISVSASDRVFTTGKNGTAGTLDNY